MKTRFPLFFFLFFSLYCAGQPLPDRITPRWLNSNDGLLQQTVRSIVKDTDGFLWISTSDGLQKYDGNRFYTITPSDNLPGALISTRQCYLFADALGHIWVSHNRGLSCFLREKGLFRNILVYPEPVAENLLEGLMPLGEDSAGNYWLYNKLKGFFYLNIRSLTLSPAGAVFMGIQFERGPQLLAIPQADGTVIITDPHQFVHFSLKQNRILRRSAPFTDPLTYLYRFGSGYLCSLNGPSGYPFFISDNGKKTSWPYTAPFGMLYTTTAGYGQLLVSYYDKLFFIDSTGTQHSDALTNETGLSLVNTGNITCLYTDKDGICWVGTNTQGLFSFRPSPPAFELIRQSDPALNFIRGLYEDTLYHRLWAGSFENGVLVYDRNGKLLKHLSPAVLSKGVTDKKGYNAFIPFNHDLMLAWGEYADPVLISRRDYTVKGSLTINVPDSIKKMFEQYGQRHYFDRLVTMKDGSCWFQFNKSIGLMRFSQQKIQLEKLIPLPAYYNEGLIAEAEHTLWWGNHSTVYKYSIANGKLSRFAGTGNALVKTVLPLRNQLWTGTDKGVYLFDSNGKELRHLTLADGLPNDYIYSLQLSDDGRIWGSTNNGLFSVTTNGESVQAFGTDDGLQGREFNTNAFLKLADGSLIWGGTNGINRLRNSGNTGRHTENNIHITAVQSGDSLLIDPVYYKNTGSIELPSYLADITVSFSGKNNAGYSYRITGLQENWQYATRVRQLNLALSPGTYQLEIKEGKPADGNPVSRLRISVSPPWYLRWYIKLAGLLVAMFAAAGIVYVYRRRKEQQLQTELETVKKIQQERERISRDLHDHVGSQVTYLLMNVEKAEETGTSQISPIREAGRNIMDSLRETIWALGEAPVTVTGFADKLKTYTQKYIPLPVRFEEQISADNELPKEQVLHLFRICQETLSNSVKHSNTTEMTITVQNSRDMLLRVIIADKGRGFDPLQQQAQGHYGLSNMKKRAAEAGIQFTIDSSPGNGTTIQLSLNNA